MNTFHDPAFWGFLTAMAGTVRWLLSVMATYRTKAQEEKTASDRKLMLYLQEAVTKITPVIERHSEVIKSFDATATKVFEAESRMTGLVNHTDAMTKDLTIKITNLGSSLMNTNLLVKDLTPRLEKIETEIIKIKDDWIFVRTKK